MAATAGIVRPMLASADPKAKFKLVCSLLARAAFKAGKQYQGRDDNAHDRFGCSGTRNCNLHSGRECFREAHNSDKRQEQQPNAYV